MDIGNMHLDDMDMDFATLFDPANELSDIQARGNRWPVSPTAGADAAASPTPTPMLMNHQDWSTNEGTVSKAMSVEQFTDQLNKTPPPS